MFTSHFESSDFKKLILESSSEQFKTVLPHMTLSEIAECFVMLQTQPALNMDQKLIELFHFIDYPSTLEKFGKLLSVPHFLSLLKFLAQHPDFQNRFIYILVGLHPIVFSQALRQIQENEFDLLKHEALLEPLQYHLTQFAHEGEVLKQETEAKAEQFMQNLQFIRIENLTQETLDSLIFQINSLRKPLLDYLEVISTVLSIVWQTNRIDLIEKLSTVKESIQHQLNDLIGNPTLDHLHSSGLYLMMEQSLSHIFDSVLKDDDSALEGLTRLSIWYLKDYWELGLLPSIQPIQELELDSSQFTDEEKLASHQQLYSFVQNQLNRLQIGTVGKLKKAFIYSKPLLKNYIDKHQNLLQRKDIF